MKHGTEEGCSPWDQEELALVPILVFMLVALVSFSLNIFIYKIRIILPSEGLLEEWKVITRVNTPGTQ